MKQLWAQERSITGTNSLAEGEIEAMMEGQKVGEDALSAGDVSRSDGGDGGEDEHADGGGCCLLS